MTGEDQIKHEIEAEARKLFSGAVRRVEWLRYGDTPVLEPGEIMPQLVLAGSTGTGQPRTALKEFQRAHAPALKRFRHELAGRWPQIWHVGVVFEDDRGHRGGGMIQTLDDEHGPRHEGVPVTAWLGAAELEVADTLIASGAVTSRGEALSWALNRVREDPANPGRRPGSRGRPG